MEEEEPSQSDNLIFTNPSKRNLENKTVDISEEARATKRPKTRYSCSKCTFSTSVSTNLETHMRSHGGMNGKFKCPSCDYSCNLKHVVEHHYSRFHDKPITSSSKDLKIDDGTIKGKDIFVDVGSTSSSNKELATKSTKAIRKKNLKVKLFPSHVKINTRRTATVRMNPNLHQGNGDLKTVGKAAESQPLNEASGSEIDVESLVDSTDLLGHPESNAKKKSADTGVQSETPASNKMYQLSLEEIGEEEKTLHELINKLEVDYENGKRSLTAAQLEHASANELKSKLERCLEILGDGHDQPSAFAFEAIRCSAQNDVKEAIEQVEAARSIDLAELKRSQEGVLKELLAYKIRLAKIEGLKSIKIAEVEVKKRMELLDTIC